MSNKNGFIRLATDKDVEKIHQWLMVQETEGIQESFLCNWDLTYEIYLKGKLFVYIDENSMNPVGYMWPDFGIVEVANNMRGKGIGRELVEYGKTNALNSDISVLNIECSPMSSIPFWEKMGFTIYEDNKAYFILEKKLEVNNDGDLIPIEINFYPENKKWELDTKPEESFNAYAILDNKGVIYFYNRISVFTEDKEWRGDPVVEIIVNGKQVYLDKAKYSKAKTLGVIHADRAYSIERLNLK